MAWFIIDVVEQMDLGYIIANIGLMDGAGSV